MEPDLVDHAPKVDNTSYGLIGAAQTVNFHPLSLRQIRSPQGRWVAAIPTIARLQVWHSTEEAIRQFCAKRLVVPGSGNQASPSPAMISEASHDRRPPGRLWRAPDFF